MRRKLDMNVPRWDVVGGRGLDVRFLGTAGDYDVYWNRSRRYSALFIAYTLGGTAMVAYAHHFLGQETYAKFLKIAKEKGYDKA